jgi:hypothetical protein
MTASLRSDRCSACHVNVHRDSIKEDCASCHSENSFKAATFDHAEQTRFALDGGHERIACVKCHQNVSGDEVPLPRKVADYSGARPECVACHVEKDPHKGEFGRACDACHNRATFSVKSFRHPRSPAFFAGEHQPVGCVKCHQPDRALRPVRAAAPAMTCVACHQDVHLGQFKAACDQCHTVDGSRFRAVAFSHDRARLPLTGKHDGVACTKCHPTEARTFPAHAGTAVVFTPVDVACASCHKDPHLGQVDQRCETCHTTGTFAVTSYAHRGLDDFFAGFHGRYGCRECHKEERGRFPSGQGVAVRFTVGRTCAACHANY